MAKQIQKTERGDSLKLSELVEDLNPDFESGLSDSQVSERLDTFGKNILFPKRRGAHWGLLAFLKEPMVWLLVIAAVVYWLLGELVDAAVMALAIIPIGLIDVVIEIRKDRALERLEKLGELKVTVVRNGGLAIINPDDLVPGDRLLIEEGHLIMADCAIVESSDLRIDESSLTGESIPVDKGVSKYYSEEFFGNTGSVFAGTRVLGGKGTCLVVKTGQRTYFGKIGGVLVKTVGIRTKLQMDIDRVVRVFGTVAVVLSIALVLLELLLGQGLSNAILSGVSLAIAAIPEELPVVFTLFLSLGMLELARSNALVKKLPAVEALGSVNVVCTDKTGTLTAGKMSVVEFFTDKRYNVSEFLQRSESGKIMLEALMACEKDPFDYMEKAIYEVAEKTIAIQELKSWDLVQEFAFDVREKYMSHIWRHQRDNSLVISAKGAVEAVLQRCSLTESERTELHNANEKMGDEGVRVLALATKPLASIGSREESESNMRFVALLGFYDPLRENITRSIAEAQNSGVRVVMLTGDHKTTAHAVAHRAGLEHDEVISGDELESMNEAEFLEALKKHNIFCRVLPQQKLRIVEELQKLGYSVAVTGDGINDAPALKRADIGIAMGQRGTEVAKEASSLVLLDDNFKTIVGAIKNGRKIYDNIQKAFRYLIAFHVPIFLSALIVPILRLPLLLIPIDIVVLELVLHPVVSIVFERQKAESQIMARGPRRRNEPILDRAQLVRLIGIGSLICLFSLSVYLWGYSVGFDENKARSFGLSTMILCQLAIIPTELGQRRTRLADVLENRYFLGMVGIVIIAYVLAMYFPPTASVMQIAALSASEWLLVILLSAIVLVVAELTKRKAGA